MFSFKWRFRRDIVYNRPRHSGHILPFGITGLICGPSCRSHLKLTQIDWGRIRQDKSTYLLTLGLIEVVAAYFVQNVVTNYEHHHSVLQTPDMSEPVISDTPDENQETKGKECSNLMVLLSELYNFQVISSVLVFDLIRQLLNNTLHEFDVELLLKLMRSAWV